MAYYMFLYNFNKQQVPAETFSNTIWKLKKRFSLGKDERQEQESEDKYGDVTVCWRLIKDCNEE